MRIPTLDDLLNELDTEDLEDAEEGDNLIDHLLDGDEAEEDDEEDEDIPKTETDTETSEKEEVAGEGQGQGEL